MKRPFSLGNLDPCDRSLLPSFEALREYVYFTCTRVLYMYMRCRS